MAQRGEVSIKTIAKTMITKAIIFKIVTPILIITIILASLTVVVKENRQAMTRSAQANIYSALEGLTDKNDLSALVQIKGDDSTGYYLEFVDDIDERLEKVLKADRQSYKAVGVEDVSTLKKFIKAHISTEFPHLGAQMTGGSRGVVGSIDGDPDLSNRDLYPNDDQAGWCQWYTTGRIREVYGIDIPSNPPRGSMGYPGDNYQDWLLREYGDYFEASDTPTTGAVFYALGGVVGPLGHVSFIRSYDPSTDTIVIEDRKCP